jgi:hypothetical protein
MPTPPGTPPGPHAPRSWEAGARGLAALVNGITGSAVLAWISYVAGFGLLLAKGDDIFKSRSP